MAQQILVKLAKSRETLLSVITTLNENLLERRSSDGWSIRQILTHLVNAEEDHRQVIEVTLLGRTDLIPREFSLDKHNQQRLHERGSLSYEAIRAGLDEQRRATETLLQSLSDEQLATNVPHPALGNKTVDEIFRVIALHERMHAQEIAALLKEGA
ncbi:MAG TPA: DinB family protein [Aggregatilineaceae bacterium]|nr:DinB family protein [Aggregatilineaceae bacterium]